MPVLRSTQKGDLYVEVAVQTPTNLTARQKELLAEFDKAGQPGEEGLFSKVKKGVFGGD